MTILPREIAEQFEALSAGVEVAARERQIVLVVDGTDPIPAEITERIRTALARYREEFARDTDRDFVLGSGVGEPIGFLSSHVNPQPPGDPANDRFRFRNAPGSRSHR